MAQLSKKEKENLVMGFAETCAARLEGKDLRGMDFDDIVTLLVEALDPEC